MGWSQPVDWTGPGRHVERGTELHTLAWGKRLSQRLCCQLHGGLCGALMIALYLAGFQIQALHLLPSVLQEDSFLPNSFNALVSRSRRPAHSEIL